MAEKLLEKSRNIFLSLTPPENLIPKKRVKTSKRNSYQNHRISNLKTPPNTLNRFFHEKNQASIHMGKTPIYATLKNILLENINHIALVPPVDHSVVDRLHFDIGGNINRFLKINEKKNTPSIKNAANKTHLTPLENLATSLVPSKSGADFLYRVNDSVLSSKMKGKQIEDEREGKTYTVFPFYLKWNQKHLPLADFIKGRLYENIWKSLFSSYDLNYFYNTQVKNYKSSIKIKNQHKSELMEHRKIAIFYGNLSRNSLACLMQRAGESKFLSTLERRLDVVLKRALFFPSIWAARQWIHQGKILVNHEVCSYNSYLLQPGDIISIKERYKSIWRGEYFKNFKEFNPVKRVRDTNVYQKETPYKSPTSYSRFLFPPHLMRKWDKWCQLWGNCISPKTGGHSWSSYAWNFFLHPVFNDSACAGYLYLKYFTPLRNNLHKLMYANRQSTPILLWLKELYKNSFARKKHYMYQLISSLLLLQQRGRVIDGLFQQRWSRLFTKKKPKKLKKKNCQWGGIKPMHLECSYSCATVVYLFTPQKLVWPSHINVLLLKSALSD